MPFSVILATKDFDNEYPALLNERERILKQRMELLGSKTLLELQRDHQIAYSHLNKQLMENYWQGFMLAKEKCKYELAALEFQKAYDMGYWEAISLSESVSFSNSVVEEPCSDNPVDNYIKGLILHLGLGCPKNLKEAIRFYTKAAQQGLPSAQFILCQQYYKGFCEGTGIDDEQVITWLRNAVQQGLVYAIYLLAYYVDNGTDEHIENQIRQLYQSAAQKGHHSAQHRMGFYCLDANNRKEAMDWFQLSAEQGLSDAQDKLGSLYLENKNESEAVYWFRLAAEQKHIEGLINLGQCYEFGVGVERDFEEAVRCYRLATFKGSAVALDRLRKLEIPLADYIIELYNVNGKKIIDWILAQPRIFNDFFTKDIEYLFRVLNDNAISNWIKSLLIKIEFVTVLNKNHFIIEILTTLDKAIKTHSIEASDNIISFMNELVGIINFSDAPAPRIEQLLYFLYELYDINQSEDVTKQVILLWHRASTLQVPMNDSALNRLLATRLVNHLFGNEYRLKFNPDFQKEDLAALIFACEKETPLAVDQLNKVLTEPLVIHSNFDHLTLLPRLKACLTNPETWGGEIPPALSDLTKHLDERISDDNPLDNHHADQLMSELRKYAKRIHAASKLSLFSASIQPEVIHVAQIIFKGKSDELLGWIERNEGPKQNPLQLALTT